MSFATPLVLDEAVCPGSVSMTLASSAIGSMPSCSSSPSACSTCGSLLHFRLHLTHGLMIHAQARVCSIDGCDGYDPRQNICYDHQHSARLDGTCCRDGAHPFVYW